MLPRIFVALLVTAALISSPVTFAKEVFKKVDRIVVIGDLHGDYDQFVRLLQHNKLVDEDGDWAAGKTHLVQMGDVTDRGPDSLKIIKRLQELEKQAKRKGGRVHVLIGNHEAMNIQGDLRYVHPGEYKALTNARSEFLREDYLKDVLAFRAKIDPTLLEDKEATLEKLRKEFPIGYVEHRLTWEPGQEHARWVARLNTALKINDVLFVHAGLNPHGELLPLKTINRQLRKEMSQRLDVGMFNDEQGPLWYRGLAGNPASIEQEPLTRMLDYYGVNHVIIGHTPTHGAVMSRFGGRVILVDVGISAHYGGNLANLVIEDGKFSVIHRGTLVPLPMDNGSLDDYLQLVADLDPEGSNLKKWVKSRSNRKPGMEAETGEENEPLVESAP